MQFMHSIEMFCVRIDYLFIIIFPRWPKCPSTRKMTRKIKCICVQTWRKKITTPYTKNNKHFLTKTQFPNQIYKYQMNWCSQMYHLVSPTRHLTFNCLKSNFRTIWKIPITFQLKMKTNAFVWTIKHNIVIIILFILFFSSSISDASHFVNKS